MVEIKVYIKDRIMNISVELNCKFEQKELLKEDAKKVGLKVYFLAPKRTWVAEGKFEIIKNFKWVNKKSLEEAIFFVNSQIEHDRRIKMEKEINSVISFKEFTFNGYSIFEINTKNDSFKIRMMVK